MTTVADFDIATDVKVELYVPNSASNVFILGVSELGGTDVLGGSGEFVVGYSLLGGTDVLSDGSGALSFVWEPIEADVVKFNSSLGGSIQSNTYFQPEPGTLAIQLQSFTYDPSNNSSVRAGTRIRVRVDDGTVDETLFAGFLDSISVSYRPEGLNLIDITAYDPHKRVVNSRIETFDTTEFGDEVTPLEQIETIADALGYFVSAESDDPAGYLPSTTATDVIANTYLNDALLVGLAVFWINPQTNEFELRNRPLATTGGATTYVIGNNHPAPGDEDPYHLCMSDIEVDSNADTDTNSLRVSLKSDTNTYVVVKDQDSIDLYGELAQDVTINTTDSVELTRWANAAFTGTPAKFVRSVATPAIDRQNNLTQAAFFTPGTLVGVNYQTDNLNIVDYYTVVKVRHSVDVNRWFTTLELWKEF